MPKFLLYFLCFVAFSTYAQTTHHLLIINNLECKSQVNPLGIEIQHPQLSWQISSDLRNDSQTAYRILVADKPEKLALNQGEVWDSGKIMSDQSIQILYQGKPLKSAKKYYWKVMIWTKSGQSSQWSNLSSWQMGLLTRRDWGNAQWIALDKLDSAKRVVPGIHVPEQNKDYKNLVSGQHALPQFRKEINITKSLKNATVFVSGLGHYEMSLNGQKVGERFLSPGWTNYDKYSFYNSFDVTQTIRMGVNTFGIMLGNGFYNIPNQRYRKLLTAFGNPKVIFKLLLEYTDGTFEEIVSDQTWKVTSSPITFSSIFGGEDYDATLYQKGWQLSNFDDKQWKTPIIVKGSESLIAEMSPPIKIMQTFSPIRVTNPQQSSWIYDLGQNFSGIPEISVSGPKNQTIKITPAELLDDKGLATQSAVGEPVYFRYTLNGENVETWHPQFTYYGFRYLQIEGAVPEGEKNPDSLPVIKSLRGLHTSNSAKKIGTFSCSNDLFNQIFHLIDWSIKSNLASVMTDCPHREKLGWLEQTYLMGNSVRYNYDMAGFFGKTIQDMRIAQLTNGLVPDIAPEYVPFEGGFRDSPEWGSASVILPWYVYQWYGDKNILSENYEMMKKYTDFLTNKAINNILSYGLGDWYDLGPKSPGKSQLTPAGITSTATYYYDVTIVEKVAHLLNKPVEAEKYRQLGLAIKKSFNEKFFDPTKNQYGTGSQTANAMAVYLGLVSTENKVKVVENLIKDTKDSNNAMTAGDIGFRYLIQTLNDVGASDVIFDMNSQSNVPGYGYQLTHGATALTESWPALRDVSNNHLMLGHLMEWFYNGLGGIRQSENAVAFKEIIINPQIVGNVTEAHTSYESPYGKISCDWKKQAKQFDLEVAIPFNTTAIIYLPITSSSSMTENGQPTSSSKEIKFIRLENNKTLLKIGSGKYHFVVND